MSLLEDALLFFVIVRRHLQVLRLGLNEAYPAEDWGFTYGAAGRRKVAEGLDRAAQRPASTGS